ncbi:hypothetical protein D9M68_649860 [compost metagenome]
MNVRTCAARDFVGAKPLERLHSEALAGRQGTVPRIDMLGCGSGPEPAFLLKVGIDRMFCAELAKFINRPLSALTEESRLSLIAKTAQGADLRPPGHDEAAIAT